eukprot:5560721-Prymnesium_polylepis.1
MASMRSSFGGVACAQGCPLDGFMAITEAAGTQAGTSAGTLQWEGVKRWAASELVKGHVMRTDRPFDA